MKNGLLGFLLGISACVLVGGGFLLVNQQTQEINIINPVGKPKEYPLRKYAINSLKERILVGSDFMMGEQTATESGYGVYKFSFKTEGKLVTGLVHKPDKCSEDSPCPVIVQSRGYIYPQNFVSGAGTTPSAREYVKAGFVTLAPDFLGFGGSDKSSENVFEARFQTYTTVLDLLSLIPEIKFIDSSRINLWGHSNGGQITLTVLEVTGKVYPTVLWAPVTAEFPYSILYYSDDDDDGGEGLRKELSRFEADYDADEFAMINFLELIHGPIQLHVGGEDDLVPLKWGRSFNSKLKKLEKQIVYYEYPLADHNLKPNWSEVVAKDIDFFLKNSSKL